MTSAPLRGRKNLSPERCGPIQYHSCRTSAYEGNNRMNYPDTRLLIDGRWQDASDGRTISVTNPATGQLIGQVAHAGFGDLERAVAAAEKGARIWREAAAFDRAQVMLKAAGLLRERAESIGPLLTMEQGKPLAQSIFEPTRAADELEWAASEGLRAYGRVIPARNAKACQMVVRQPVGAVALFTPWNFPLNQLARKIAPALAAGCSIVAKAPEETPAAPAELVRALQDAGLPDGVLNLVFGTPSEISSFLIAHPVIRKISFTGSVTVGKQLAELAGRHMKRATMELGGHAPVILCQDGDIEATIPRLTQAKIFNAGQTCATPNRFLVHESRYARFVEGLSAGLSTIRVGDGLDKEIQMGPLANDRRLAAMEHFVADAVVKGARILTGGYRIGNQGNFFAPTVIADAPLDCALQNVEAFGPIAVVSSFRQLDEAIAEANRLPYGLAAYAVTRSIETANRLANEVECGSLIVNDSVIGLPEMPFGGVKDSGYGAEGGTEGIDAYLNSKLIHMV